MITVAEALKPVRDALISKAEHDAGQTLAAAMDNAAHAEDMARAHAKEVLDDAQACGEADARLLLANERAAARRTARTAELHAQWQVYELLRQRVHASVCELRNSPDYPELRAALTTHALMALGPATVAQDHPSGGIVARAPGRVLDLSFAALADQAIDRVAPELEGLWTP